MNYIFSKGNASNSFFAPKWESPMKIDTIPRIEIPPKKSMQFPPFCRTRNFFCGFQPSIYLVLKVLVQKKQRSEKFLRISPFNLTKRNLVY